MSVVQPKAQRLRKGSRQKWGLTALGLVFALSALLRLGTLDGAIAEAVADPDLGPGQPADMRETHLGTGLAQALQAALEDIEDLRRQLNMREAELSDRERAVTTAQALVEERLAELEAAETRLAALIETSDTAAENDLDRLTRVYETMPPEQAAAIFEQMQPSFAAGFLSRMAPAASANLMAELTPEQAYAVSVLIATRNSSAPRLSTAP